MARYGGGKKKMKKKKEEVPLWPLQGLCWRARRWATRRRGRPCRRARGRRRRAPTPTPTPSARRCRCRRPTPAVLSCYSIPIEINYHGEHHYHCGLKNWCSKFQFSSIDFQRTSRIDSFLLRKDNLKCRSKDTRNKKKERNRLFHLDAPLSVY